MGRPPSRRTSRGFVAEPSSGERVAGAEHHQLAGADRSLLGPRRALTRQDVGQCVEVGGPGEPELGARRHGGVGHGDRGVGRARALVAGHVAGDQSQQRTTVSRGQQRDRVALQALVAGGDHLVLARKVHPQLDAVEEPAADDQLLGRRLDVEDAAAGRHPLGGAVADDTAAAVGVLVLEGAVDHVGDGLEAPVGVPVGAPRLARRVVDLAHLVHVDEGVEVGHVHAGEGPADREALALVPAGGGGHRANGAILGLGGGGSDPGKRQRVSSDSRHLVSFSCKRNYLNPLTGSRCSRLADGPRRRGQQAPWWV